MTTHTSFRHTLHLAWQALRLYSRHFLPLFLIGGLPMLVYTLALLIAGHSASPKMDLQAEEILPPALRSFFLWNLPSLLLLQPLCSGALVAAVGQLQRQEVLQPAQALRTAMNAWKPLLGAAGLFWLPAAATAGFGYWIWHHTQTSPGQTLGGMLMIALVAGFVCYWWVRWSFVNQMILEEGSGPVEAFGRSSRLVGGQWGRVVGLYTILTLVPSLLDNLLGLVGPWAVPVGQSLVGPLSTVGMTLLYWELRGRVEEAAASPFGLLPPHPEGILISSRNTHS